MSAQEERGREPSKPKGKTLGSFLGFLPGFSSSRNQVANAHSSAREAQPAADPTGAPTPKTTQAQTATDLKQMAREVEEVEKLPPPSDKMISGAKDLVCSTMTKTKDAISSGVANVMDSAKGVVQGGLSMTGPALTGTKEAVASGVTGAVGMAKGTVQTGVDTTKTMLTNTKNTIYSGVTGAVNMATGAVQGGLDTSKAVLTSTKDTVSTGLTGAVGVAKGAIQTGMDTTKTVLTGTKDTVSTGLTGAVGVAKSAVQTGVDTSKTILTGTKDTVSTGLTGAVGVAKGAVQTGMNTTKTLLTGTKDTVSTGLTGAVGVAKGAIQTGMDTSKTILTGTKDTVSTGLTGAIAVTKSTVQTGMDTSKTILTGTKDTIQNWLPAAQESSCGGVINDWGMDKCGEQTVLSPLQASSCNVSSLPDTLCADHDLANEATASSQGLVSTVVPFQQGSTQGPEDVGCMDTICGHEGVTGFTTLLEELGDIFHPMNAEEQAQLAASEPGPRVPAADQSSYFVRLGDLAHSFRQRAFEHAMSHLQHSQFQARATLAQLEDSFRLIEKIKQAPEGQPWPDLSLRGGVEKASTQEVPDLGALSRACGLIQRLHVAYSTLASGLQGLPAELQQRVRQARHSLCELYGIVSSASSIAELPAERLAQSHESVGQAWQGLEKLLDSVQHSPPLSWLVGPFDLHPSEQKL